MSLIQVSSDSHFPIQNLPYGIFTKTGSSDTARPGVAIGDYVLDLKAVADEKHFDGPKLSKSDCFQQPTLNEFISLGRPAWKEARIVIKRLLSGNDPTLRDSHFNREKCLIPMSLVTMQPPVDIKDFEAFYHSLSGVTECVKNMGGTDFKVDPNWLSQPLAHLVRSASVVVSRIEILSSRKQDSQKSSSNSKPSPSLGPSKKLEFGAIVGAIVGPGNELENIIEFSKAKEHIFGLVLLNPWNIKDKKMKPFDDKNFSTIISPWIVTLDAIVEMPPRQVYFYNPPRSQSKDKLSQNPPHPSPGTSKDKLPHERNSSSSTSKDKPPQNHHPSSSTSKGKQPQNHAISFKGHGYCVLFGTGKILPSTN